MSVYVESDIEFDFTQAQRVVELDNGQGGNVLRLLSQVKVSADRRTAEQDFW